MLLFTLLSLITGCAHAAISVPDRAQIGQYVYTPANAGGEQSTSGWVASGGTFTTTTTAANVGLGNAAFSWDSSAASQTLTSVAVAVPSSMVGQTLVLSFDAKCASGTCTHTYSADDGSTDYSTAPTISSSTSFFVRQAVRFNVGSAGNIRVKITSVNANEPTIYIDNIQIQQENMQGKPFSGATVPRKEGSIKVDCDGSPSILQNNDNMAASVSGGPAAGCAVVFTTGYFSAEPECMVTPIDNINSSTLFATMAVPTAVSSTGITVIRQILNEAAAPNFIQTQDGDFSVYCRGLP